MAENAGRYHIGFDAAQLEELRTRLNPKQARQAVFQALFRTLRTGVKDISASARQILALKADRTKRVIVPRMVGDSGAVISIRGDSIPMAYYSVRRLSRGISVRLRRDKPPLKLRHAFLATMASGHEGVFLRAKGRGKLTAHGYAQRLPIDEKYGPSVLSLFKKRELTAIGKEEIEKLQALLRKNLEGQINRFLNRKKNG